MGSGDNAHVTDCDRFGHDYSRSKVVREGAFGIKTTRVVYCSFCGVERPRRGKQALGLTS